MAHAFLGGLTGPRWVEYLSVSPMSCLVPAACSLTEYAKGQPLLREAATNHTERKENSQPQYLRAEPDMVLSKMLQVPNLNTEAKE